MRPTRLCLLLTLALPAAAPAEENAARFSSEATEKRVKDDVTYLAADELQGRGIGTKGIDLAADYIAEQFKEAGLNTEAVGGGPFQTFYLTSKFVLGENNTATLSGPDGSVPLELAKQYTPVSLSSSGKLDHELAFVGYGITAAELGYDDYAGIDVEGKVVIMLRHEPRRGDEDSRFNGTRNSPHAYFTPKITNARAHKAAGAILVTDAYEIAKRVGTKSNGFARVRELARQEGLVEQVPDAVGNRQRQIHEFSELLLIKDEGHLADFDELLNVNVPTTLNERRFPVVHCTRQTVDAMLRGGGGPGLAALEREIDRELKPQSRHLPGWRINANVELIRRGKGLKNVIGVLEGEGEHADETVVVGAHYDHLGMGGRNSLARWTVTVHNGADDNASGTAGLMEIARRIAAHDEPLKRRVVFIAFTAEESGLIGSDLYVKRPLYPLENTVAMVNLDMVGRLRRVMEVNGVGTAAEFPLMIDRLAAKHGLRVRKGASGFGPSDHASFYARSIPVLHFFTGLHSDYHRPSDDSHKINYEGLAQISEMAAATVLEIAQAEAPPTRRSEDSLFAGLLRPQVFLGVYPDLEKQAAGYAVGRLHPGGAAEKAGMVVGDVIVKVDDHQVDRPTDLPPAILKHKPGDEVMIVVRRGEEEKTFDITLGRRGG